MSKYTNGTTGDFVVVPESHLYHSNWIQWYLHHNNTFVTLPVHNLSTTTNDDNKQQLQPVTAKLDDMILWDFRIIYDNMPALVPPTTRKKNELLRVVSYVCLMPRAMVIIEGNNNIWWWCTLESLVKRPFNSVTTSHLPNLSTRLKLLVSIKDDEKDIQEEFQRLTSW